MAAGFPVKADYASGDVLTAAQMNDLSSTLNYLDPTAKGDLFPASSGTALTRLAVGANDTILTADSSTASGLKWAAAASSGGMTLIATTTFDNSVSTYTYSSLGSYKHLYVVGQGLTTNQNGVSDSINIRFNSDTGSNYNRVGIGNNGATPTAVGANAASAGYLAYLTFADDDDVSLDFGTFMSWIPNYGGSGYKSAQGNSMSYLNGTTPRAWYTMSTWNNTSAITSMTLFSNSGQNFRAGIITIYGVS
jgi:hypothetical protein